MINERKPVSGEFYRHFKGNLYQIITIAAHSETAEELVIYQALYGDYRIYARPMSMFLSETDHAKYPDILQQYRFEKVTVSNTAEKPSVLPEYVPIPKEAADKTGIEGVNPVILKFLDAELPEEQLKIINHLKTEDITQELIDTISISLDFVPDSGTIEQGLSSIKKYLETYIKYNGRRLR